MRIGVDVDGVLADFNSSYIDKMIEVAGRDLFPPRPFEIPTWAYPEHYGYTQGEVSAAWKSIKQSDHFWFNLEPYADTEAFLEELCGFDVDHDIYFVTSRVGEIVKAQTEYWLMKHGFAVPTVLISSEKGEICHALQIDYYLDDRTENCQSVADLSPNTHGFMLSRPWNQAIPNGGYLTTLSHFMEILNGHKTGSVRSDRLGTSLPEPAVVPNTH